MTDWQILNQKTVYKNPWFRVEKKRIKRSDNTQGDYFTLRRFNSHGFVVVMAQDKKQNLVLIKQFRPTLMAYTWEVPMGGIEKHEQPIQAAQRELLEETSLKAKSWQEVGQFYVGAGHTDLKGTIFLATDLFKSKQQASGEPGEIIDQTKRISLTNLEKQIRNGKIQDGPTISSFYLSKPYLKMKKESK